MTLSNRQRLIEKGTDILNNEKANEIYWKLFLNWKTQGEISEELYPYLYDNKSPKMIKEREKRKIKNLWKKGKVNEIVSKYVYAFDGLGWLEKRNKKQNNRGKDPLEYKATLKPFFDNLDLTSKQKTTIKQMINGTSNLLEFLDFNFLKAMEMFVEILILDFLNLNSPNFERFNWFGYELAEQYYNHEEEIKLQLLGERLRYQLESTSQTIEGQKKLEKLNEEEIIELIMILGGYAEEYTQGFLQDDILGRIQASPILIQKLKKKGNIKLD